MMIATTTIHKKLGAPRTGKADVTMMLRLSKELSALLIKENIETGLTKTEIIRRMLTKRYEDQKRKEKE
jgi:hypothetical protein